MKVTIQKTANVATPVRAHDTDAGLDLHVPEGQGCLVRPGAVYTIDLGIRAAIPDGYYGQLTLRSSAGAKGLTIPHGAGIIDSGYRGNLKVLVAALADPVLVAAGERICQLIILPLPDVTMTIGDVDDKTERGSGGFGSTGVDAVVNYYVSSPRRAASLTIGQLMGYLQDAAWRYGNDTPVAVLADSGVDYEQADAMSIINAVKSGKVDGWDQYRADPEGTPHGGDRMNNKEEKMDNTTHLTVDGLMGELQEIASRYGNIPVVTVTTADADYEQATAPFIMHARREPVPDDWDLFHVAPDGEPVAVIS